MPTVPYGPATAQRASHGLDALPASAAPLEVVVSIVNSTGPWTVPAVVAFHTNVSGGLPPYNESWDFGDGSPEVVAQNITHSYLTAGSYLVLVSAVDASGDRASATVPVQFASTGAPGSPDVWVSSQLATPGPNGTAVEFQASPPVFTVYTSSRYHWEFGDGGSSTLAEPTHTYSLPGDYAVGLSLEFNMTFPGYPDQTWWNTSYLVNEVVIAPGSSPPVATVVPASTYVGNQCLGPVTVDTRLSAVVLGGAGIFRYAWTAPNVTAGAHNATVDLVQLPPGVYNATVVAADQAGSEASASSTFAVYPPDYPALPPCTSPSYPLLPAVTLGVAIGVAIVVAVAAVMVVRRRRRRAATFDSELGQNGG
jgi:PKD domain